MDINALSSQLAAAWPETGSWVSLRRVGQGHIHQSFQLATDKGLYFLQQFNHFVFPDPEGIAANLRLLAILPPQEAIRSLPCWLLTSAGEAYAADAAGQLWRLFPWIDCTEPVATETASLHDIAAAFAAWTRSLGGLSPQEIREPIPGFHQLPSQWQSLETAWNEASGHRKFNAAETYGRLCKGAYLLDRFRRLQQQLPRRIIHADAKADNLMFSSGPPPVTWVVDLDTVMAGQLWMDVGDMIRSMACSHREDYPVLEEVHVLPQACRALLEGYLEGGKGWVTELEASTLAAGAECILFEQSLRFLADHLRGNRYYPVQQDGDNLLRAQNQLMLWESYTDLLLHKKL